MTAVNWRVVLTAAIASSVVFAVTTGARAHDGEHWKREHWEREHWEHRHHFVPPGHRHYHERAPQRDGEFLLRLRLLPVHTLRDRTWPALRDAHLDGRRRLRRQSDEQ